MKARFYGNPEHRRKGVYFWITLASCGFSVLAATVVIGDFTLGRGWNGHQATRAILHGVIAMFAWELHLLTAPVKAKCRICGRPVDIPPAPQSLTDSTVKHLREHREYGQ